MLGPTPCPAASPSSPAAHILLPFPPQRHPCRVLGARWLESPESCGGTPPILCVDTVALSRIPAGPGCPGRHLTGPRSLNSSTNVC